MAGDEEGGKGREGQHTRGGSGVPSRENLASLERPSGFNTLDRVESQIYQFKSITNLCKINKGICLIFDMRL
jgi:hypothetical protein